VIPEASSDERQAILKDQGAIYLPSVRPFDGVRDVFRILSEQGGRSRSPLTAKG
jgi:hypothetical protein